MLSYFVTTASDELLDIYGGMPSIESKQDAYLKKFFGTRYPHVTVDTDIVRESVAYSDNPNHESWMPSFQESVTCYNEFWDNLVNNAGLDVDAEAEKLRTNLDKIFAAAKN